MKRALLTAILPFLLSVATAHAAEVGISLRGSRASMERQNRIAQELAYTFLRTDAQVERLAEGGQLVPVPGSEHLTVLASRAYARPAVRDFVTRLAEQYAAGCGEPLVVTSLTRPSQRQPGNASPLSVHPAGMAVDLRVSRSGRCVDWLQAELLALEELGLIDATREFRPPHFHIAVFPEAYERHAEGLVADSTARAERERTEQAARRVAAAELSAMTAPAPGATNGSGWSGATALLFAVLALVSFVLPV